MIKMHPQARSLSAVSVYTFTQKLSSRVCVINLPKEKREKNSEKRKNHRCVHGGAQWQSSSAYGSISCQTNSVPFTNVSKDMQCCNAVLDVFEREAEQVSGERSVGREFLGAISGTG